jgi:transposase InsO family protein
VARELPGVRCPQSLETAEAGVDAGGSWCNIDEVEYATLEWVDWFNNRRLLEPIGDIPPAEYEAMYYQNRDQAMAA